MTVLDKVIAAVTPTENDEGNQEARAKALAAASAGSWFSLVLEHHQQIEAAFAAVKSAQTAVARRSAQKWLATLLTGHSIAEEAVIYPAMANSDQKRHATELYAEQSAAKVQTAALDEFDPMSQDYLDKLEHLRGAIALHVKEEESEYFFELNQTADAAMNTKIARLYREEFERYMGADAKPA